MYIRLTDKEALVKRHDVAFIIKQARDVLKSKRIHKVRTNQLPHDHGQLYTTEEASRIIASIVDDSIYYLY